MSAMDLATIDIHSTSLYVSRGYPWQEWDLLRREAPVFWYEREGIAPFWAVTRHADILTVSKRSDVFVNSGRLRLATIEEDEVAVRDTQLRKEKYGWDPDEPDDFVFMDDPKHRDFRSISARRFTPAALKALERHFDELSGQFVRELEAELAQCATAGEPCEFVQAFAEKLPLAAICELLDLPPDRWQRLKVLTNVMMFSHEPDFLEPHESKEQAAHRARQEMLEHNMGLVEERRQRGPESEDLATLLAHAEIDGAPLTDQQLAGYLLLMIGAGNETTRNAISGGVHALLENPDQRACCVTIQILSTPLPRKFFAGPLQSFSLRVRPPQISSSRV